MELNIDAFEQGMAKHVIEVGIELSKLNKKNKKLSAGNIYTAYDSVNKVIAIGYAFDSSIKDIVNYSGYYSIKSRAGSKREVKLLEETLDELGYTAFTTNNQYKYSSKLLQHLEILGWPIPDIS